MPIGFCLLKSDERSLGTGIDAGPIEEAVVIDLGLKYVTVGDAIIYRNSGGTSTNRYSIYCTVYDIVVWLNVRVDLVTNVVVIESFFGCKRGQ